MDPGIGGPERIAEATPKGIFDHRVQRLAIVVRRWSSVPFGRDVEEMELRTTHPSEPGCLGDRSTGTS
jgi:hypothetical protein